MAKVDFDTLTFSLGRPEKGVLKKMHTFAQILSGLIDQILSYFSSRFLISLVNSWYYSEVLERVKQRQRCD